MQPDACVTLNATPPNVTVPLRAGPLFAAYEYASVPEPDALVPVVSHAALLAAFQAQPVCDVTPIYPLPVVAATLADEGASE